MKRIFLAFVILAASVSLHARDIYVGQYNIRNANERDVKAGNGWVPNYVEITFTEKKQGFYILNNTYTAESTSVSIVVEDVQAFSDGVQVDVPENVGFYGSNYYLTTTNSANVYHYEDYQGVQFQTSSSKYEGLLPLTIRMKAQLVFY